MELAHNEKSPGETSPGLFNYWCRGTESNCRHGDFQTNISKIQKCCNYKQLILFQFFNLLLVSFGIVWKYLTLTGTIWAQSNQEMIRVMKKMMISMNYPAAELRSIKMNFYLLNPDAEHRGILLIKNFLESSDQEIGFCHFKLGNLPKSPSAEHKMSPCSIARAAR